MQLVEELKSKLEATTGKLSELREARRPHALKALSGDKKAKTAISDLESEEAALSSEAATLAIAIEEAEREAVELAKAEAAKERAARVETAKEILTQITEASQECDGLMGYLAGALQKRADLIVQLSRTGAVYSGAVKALQRRTAVVCALNAAALNRFPGFEWITGSQSQTLVDSSAIRPDLIGGGDAE